MQDLFIDRLATLNVHQGIARLDFARLEKIDPDKKQATFTPSLRLAMPVEAFLQMAEQIGKVREAMLQQAGANPPRVTPGDRTDGPWVASDSKS